ncbi:hypothetical protein BC831DRAFT_461822 [Entophlyctis helioformis]|nr:hypothetical protein BC831DRAFT_461822 [Entophlyctis helioformis]
MAKKRENAIKDREAAVAASSTAAPSASGAGATNKRRVEDDTAAGHAQPTAPTGLSGLSGLVKAKAAQQQQQQQQQQSTAAAPPAISTLVSAGTSTGVPKILLTLKTNAGDANPVIKPKLPLLGSYQGPSTAKGYGGPSNAPAVPSSTSSQLLKATLTNQANKALSANPALPANAVTPKPKPGKGLNSIVGEDGELPSPASEYSDSGSDSDDEYGGHDAGTSRILGGGNGASRHKKKGNHKKVADWANTPEVQRLLLAQQSKDPDLVFAGMRTKIDLHEVLGNVVDVSRHRVRKDTGNWELDGLRREEDLEYKRKMGFVGHEQGGSGSGGSGSASNGSGSGFGMHYDGGDDE